MKSEKKAQKASAGSLSLQNIRVLVVEDERIIALDLRHILENFGFEVCSVVSTGEESIHAATQAHPDVVLMDIKLRGDMSGIEAARKIHECLDIPVIYLTAFSDESTVRSALTYEDFAYIRKPFEEKEIAATLHKALQKSPRQKSTQPYH